MSVSSLAVPDNNRLRPGGEREMAHNQAQARPRKVPSRHRREPNVRFGSLADILRRGSHVRFTPESGHLQCTSLCPLCANSGHLALFDYLVGAGEQAWRDS
jgi:hypothetical protein